MRNQFLDDVERFEALLHKAPLDATTPSAQAQPLAATAPSAGVCMLVSPHPDDEAISGALAWRLRHEAGWRVINVAVTLGSRLDRRAQRWAEAQACCSELGFELLAASGHEAQGLEGITPDDAQRNTAPWQDAVQALRTLLETHQPRVLICPHALDGHKAHIATSLLTQQALQAWSPEQVHLLLSEYWNTQMDPRLAVGLSAHQVAALMQGLACHAGEISRHPYHRLLPAWFADSARRGAERVNPPGSAALDFSFASLYGWRTWRSGAWHDAAPMIWPPKVDASHPF